MDDAFGEKSLYEDIFPFTGRPGRQSGTEPEIADIRAMDRAARLIYQSLSLIESQIVPGITTLKLAEQLDLFLRKKGADPGLIIRISPEETVWHGIPDERRLKPGEVVTIDVACSVRGWWADAARTFAVGQLDKKRTDLMLCAWEGTKEIVSVMKNGRIGLESAEVVRGLGLKYKKTLVTEAAGHGIGRRLHELPSLTYDGREHPALRAGCLYTAEPIFSAGSGSVEFSGSGSAVTIDGEPSAHFEVTVLLVDHGAHILGGPEWINCPPC